MRTRQIKQYGNTYVIKLSPSDLNDLGLKLDDFVNIDDIVKVLPFEESNKEMLKEIKKEVIKK